MIMPYSSIHSILCFLTVFSTAIHCLIVKSSSLEFAYSNFLAEDTRSFSFAGGSVITNGTIQITPSNGSELSQSGRVLYNETFKLRKGNGTVLTSIDTTFIFNTRPQTHPAGEGLAFILTNSPALPGDSGGQWLGIVNNQTDHNQTLGRFVVAVEFDTRKSFPEDADNNHVGLDVNSIESMIQQSFSSVYMNITDGSDIYTNLVFNGTTRSVLIICATLDDRMQATATLILNWSVDLSMYPLDDIWVGFSGSTSNNFRQLNQIKLWNFTTIEADSVEVVRETKQSRKLLLLLTLMILLPVFLYICFLLRKRTSAFRHHEEFWNHSDLGLIIEDNTKKPVKFHLKELKSATANFDPGRQLGKGGSGTVYRAQLKGLDTQVAVKRLTRSDDRRGEREYITEITTISQLSHRHLVKLIGWCHEEDELLLVYEFLPKGSLDKFIFGKDAQDSLFLNWEQRHKIICGVASALDYLHHGSINRVLHRDVKASNVMLDDEFGAKLGDFGLARVIQRDSRTHHSTVALAGTQGYIAPECYFTGRASSDADVYGFGVFIMEVACGRRPAGNGMMLYNVEGRDEDEEDDMRYIVDWLWDLYGRGITLNAVDHRLSGDCDKVQIESVLILALSCCHPDPRQRPSMRMAMQVLSGGAPPPSLPAEKPSFVWPPVNSQYEAEVPPDVVLLHDGGVLTQSIINGR